MIDFFDSIALKYLSSINLIYDLSSSYDIKYEQESGLMIFIKKGN